MNRKQSMLLALAGAALLAGTKAQAQMSYNNEDLLLNFRSTTTSSDQDLTANLGSINNFLTLGQGNSVVLDPSGGTGSFTTAQLTTVFGSSLTGVAFSAAAVQDNAATAQNGDIQGTLYLTKKATSGQAGTAGLNTTAPLTKPQSTQNQTAGKVTGQAAALGLAVNDGLVNTSTAASTADGNPSSYHTEVEQSAAASTTANYGATLANGNTVENILGSSTIYADLFQLTPSGTAVFDGYFTFNSDGEVDYTSELPAVPEPSTYGLIAGLGVLALAASRQLRAA